MSVVIATWDHSKWLVLSSFLFSIPAIRGEEIWIWSSPEYPYLHLHPTVFFM